MVGRAARISSVSCPNPALPEIHTSQHRRRAFDSAVSAFLSTQYMSVLLVQLPASRVPHVSPPHIAAGRSDPLPCAEEDNLRETARSSRVHIDRIRSARGRRNRMPSAASVKIEKPAGAATADNGLVDNANVTPLRQAITVVEHKIRNLEKRKVSRPVSLHDDTHEARAKTRRVRTLFVFRRAYRSAIFRYVFFLLSL